MKKKVTIVMEKAADGGYSCYMTDSLPHFGLQGYGDTAAEARQDLETAYEEMKELEAEEGRCVPELEFEWRYDMQSFFNYFSFLNVTKVAERAGINASQMRQYVSGISNASQKQYDKLREAVRSFASEMATATF